MKYIYKTIYTLGLHLGGYNYLSRVENYKFLIGSRYNVSIIDINLIFYQLKKSILFLNEVGKLNGFLLFYYSNIETCPYYFKIFLMNLVYYNFDQAFIDRKWSYGILTNSFTQIHRLLSSLFFLDVKSNLQNGYHNYKEDEKDKKKKKGKKNEKNKKNKKNEKGKKNEKDKMSSDKENSKIKRATHVNYDIITLLYRILLFTINKRLEGMTWEETFDSVKNYWRFFYFFKYYSFLKNHPDCFVCLNKANILNPIYEAEYLGVPLLLVSSDSIINNPASYLILSNNSSIIINVFYIILFLFSYQNGRFIKLEQF